MHSRQLVELAGLLAAHAPQVVRHGDFTGAGMEEYWSASKCRLDRWGRAMKRHSLKIRSASSARMRVLWQSIRPTIEEILTGEMLARLMGGVCCGWDAERVIEQASPLVRNIMAGQLEARHRALNLMVYGHGLRVEEAVALNRLRRRSERWTDLLLSLLPDPQQAAEFSFDADRMRDFAEPKETGSGAQLRRALIVATLRMSFQDGLSWVTPNADLNRRIAAGILGCFSERLFDTTGLLKSLWLQRLAEAASDTQVLIDELLSTEDPPDPRQAPRFGLRGDRLDLF